jgi:hypothetical protein
LALEPRGSPNAMLLSRNNSAPNADQKAEDENDRQQRRAGEGRAHHQELAHEDAERRQPGDRDDAEDRPSRAPDASR